MSVLESLKTTPAPPVLYHYTTQAGLLGILQGNCMWATAAQYLNDSSEYEYWLHLIAERLTAAANATVDEGEGARLSAISAGLTAFRSVCIVSLTTEGDSLSQWRAYGGNSGGVALGLRSARLREAAHEQGFYLFPCLYTEEQQLAAVNALIKEFRDRMIASTEWDDTDHGGCVATAMRVAVTIKNESFREEGEWRLISRPRMIKHLDFRPGVSMLIPYVRFALGEDRTAYLDAVRIGPTPHPELGVASVQMLLRNLDLLEPESRVAPTRIPFRAW
jgi:hypothetical protein